MSPRAILTLAYLGTPYTRYKSGIVGAFCDACALAARLMQSGVTVYSPIAHTHPIAVHGKIDPLDLSIWLPFDEAMMERCDTLIVAHLDGWDQSRGIAHEVAFFERAGKPIFDLDPGTLVMVRRK
jgi:nucleoside 2-deoxyribosyltransferase